MTYTIEGSENVIPAQLETASGIITVGIGSTAANQNLGNVVDSDGVPKIVNSSGVADVSGDQGQGVGSSTIANPFPVAGTASSNQIISSGNIPAVLSLTGSTGAVQWQVSSDNSTFTNISGETAVTYTLGALTATTYYRAIVTSVGGCSEISNTITITVMPLCYKPAVNSGTALETKHGITALGRAGVENDNWPMVHKGAWTVLESKEKGFVINRVPKTADLNKIVNPIEGMMVYDEEEDCLKIYTTKEGNSTAAWYCFNTQTCPE